jgi:3'-5' exoribonuclease 1
MRYVVVDLEATCWEQSSPDRMEIIEIGAVLLESAGGPVSREFDAFVQPVESPQLSEFCTRLTSIRQEDVDGAETFPVVFRRFLEWIGPEPFTLCSWGAYDLNQFRKDCRRHGVELPPAFERHVNLKQEHARLRRVRPMGMAKALAKEGISLEGTHHRGLDDARNIAKLAQIILPQIVLPEIEDSR